MQAVCIYLNKSLQTLLCNTHVFCFAFVYLCRIKPFEVEVEVEVWRMMRYRLRSRNYTPLLLPPSCGGSSGHAGK